MKTLIVLSALAAIAIAAPALQEQKLGYQSNKHRSPQNKLQSSNRREKKSPTTDNADIALDADSTTTSIQDELDVAPETSARSFSHKKPIIVKKKHGYHLYRDSAEEQAQADPQDKCTKEVKVKLCDAGNMARSNSNNKDNTFDSDMEESIKMAKEAVEHLQRDLQNIEHNTDPKMAQWKSSSGSDAEIHEDIEVARKALEHIQKNFANLESMSLRTATKDVDTLEDSEFKVANTDDAKMAQWKEAIENIQKNVEIARNIEDSFKLNSHQDDLSDPAAKSLDEPVHSHEISMKSSENKLASDNSDHMQADHLTGDHMQVEPMTASASDMKESKVEYASGKNDKKDTFEDTFPRNIQGNSVENKSNEGQEHGKSSESNVPDSDSLSSVHDEPENEKMQSAIEMKASENTETDIDLNKMQPIELMKSDTSVTHNHEQRAANEEENNVANVQIEQEKSTDNHNVAQKSAEDIADKQEIEVNADSTHFMKSAEQFESHQENKKVKNSMNKLNHDKSHINHEPKLKSNEEVDFEKSAEQNDAQITGEMLTDTTSNHGQQINSMSMRSTELENSKINKELENTDIFRPKARESMMKLDEEENGNLEIPVKIVDIPFAKSSEADDMLINAGDHFAHESQPVPSVTAPKHFNEDDHARSQTSMAMRAAGNNGHHESDHVTNLPVKVAPWQLGKVSKLSEEQSSDFQDGKFRNSHFTEDAASMSSHVDSDSQASSHNTMKQEKSADTDSATQQSQHVDVKEASDKSSVEHNNMPQWKQNHGSARAPYGYGSAAGALGAGSGLYNSAGAGSGAYSSNAGSGAFSSGAGSGALGVFPNANVGPCGIPLLLSCSPTVVSGSLAKGVGHSSYGAGSSYRGGENFKYHSKRNIKKKIEASSNQKRTPTKE